jgi:hydroxymethylpyrimidine/phosphomethylpyrimidine kinase
LDAVAGVPVVLDPVMVAKGGSRLLEAGAISALKAGLLSRAALVTPNAPELAVLTGRDVCTETEMLRAGRALLRAGAAAVLAKGGHLQGDTVVDWLLTAEAETRFAAPRRDTLHTHGTGCTLSSAVATGLAKGLSLVEAVAEARDYLQAAMDAAPGLGRGHGPLGHNFALL